MVDFFEQITEIVAKLDMRDRFGGRRVHVERAMCQWTILTFRVGPDRVAYLDMEELSQTSEAENMDRVRQKLVAAASNLADKEALWNLEETFWQESASGIDYWIKKPAEGQNRIMAKLVGGPKDGESVEMSGAYYRVRGWDGRGFYTAGVYLWEKAADGNYIGVWNT